MVEGGSLENCCAARYRGFESYRLRQIVSRKELLCPHVHDEPSSLMTAEWLSPTETVSPKIRGALVSAASPSLLSTCGGSPHARQGSNPATNTAAKRILNAFRQTFTVLHLRFQKPCLAVC